MIFVTLDNKNWCKGVYTQGKLHFDNLPQDLSGTWKYAPYLSDRRVSYASLYTNGKSIEEICPAHLEDEWKTRKDKLKAYHNSFLEAKVDLQENCFFDLVPKQFLMELCETKTKIIEYVFGNFEKPKNYDCLLGIEKIITEIAEKNLNLDLSVLKNNLHDTRARLLLSKLKEAKQISYNLFGSKTGRLTTNPKTFPILNLDSKYRSVIRPNNDAFLEIDFNAAEIRVLLALSGEKQPEGDIHLWNSKRIGCTREQAKTDIFAWLYGSKQVDSKKYENIFGLNKILERYYDGTQIRNPYGRAIKADDFHKTNYLIQSTANDMVLEQIVKINKLLEAKKSYISFMVHDSVLIDLAKEDKTLVKELIKQFSVTRFGTLPVNVSIGKDYGSLRKV